LMFLSCTVPWRLSEHTANIGMADLDQIHANKMCKNSYWATLQVEKAQLAVFVVAMFLAQRTVAQLDGR
jgi:hypothetical protein